MAKSVQAARNANSPTVTMAGTTSGTPFRELAGAGVNVELVLPVRISGAEFFAVICADDAAAAEAALGGQVIRE